MRNLLLSVALGLIGMGAHAFGQTPVQLPPGGVLTYAGNVVDSVGGNSTENRRITILTSDRHQGGEFAYSRISGTSAELRIASSYSEPGYSETETANLKLEFTGAGGGSYTSTGTYSGMNNGVPFEGTFTALGNFTLAYPSTDSAPAVSDDFNDNVKGPDLWGDDGGSGTLKEENRRINFVSSGMGVEIATRPYIQEEARYDSDFTVVIDASNIIRPASEEPDAGIGLHITNGRTRVLEVALQGYRAGNGFERPLYSRLDAGVSKFVRTNSNFTAIRIVFDPENKVLNCDYDADGPVNGYSWTRFATYGIAGSGGRDGNAEWGMSGSERFGVSLFAYSAGGPVTQGELSLDDFRFRTAAAGVGFAEWQKDFFGGSDNPEAAAGFDFDKDGVVNLLEYAFGLHPKIPDGVVLKEGEIGVGLPRWTVERGLARPVLKVEYVRRMQSDLRYSVEFSDDLTSSGAGGWSELPVVEKVIGRDGGFERIQVIDPVPAGRNRRFGRVKVELVPAAP